MGCTIQFEIRHVELWGIYENESFNVSWQSFDCTDEFIELKSSGKTGRRVSIDGLEPGKTTPNLVYCIVSIVNVTFTRGRGKSLKTDLLSAYHQPFFELQLVFAQKIAEISSQPFDQALLRFTALYRILGLGGSLDPTHPVWQGYLQKLQHVSEQANFTHQFYR